MEKIPPSGFNPKSLIPPPLPKGPWRIMGLALDVAGKCNLACKYCAERSTQPERQPMSFETLNAAWHFLFRDGKPKKNYTIRLGSGEPLLAIPVLQRLRKMAKDVRGCETGNSPTIALTTNGTLIDEKMGEWLFSSGWQITISLDGPKSTHDYWRVTPSGEGTYRTVAKAVSYLAKNLKERLSVTAVLCRGSDPSEVFSEIENLGVRRIMMAPVDHKDPDILPATEDVKKYKRFINNYAQRVLEKSDDENIPVYTPFEEMVFRVMGYKLKRVPCGAGRSFLGVGSNGHLYPCFRFIGIEDYRLGTIYTGLDLKATEAFQNGPGRPYEEHITCSDCWAAPLCGGECFASSEMFGPGDSKPIKLHCEFKIANAKTAVWLVDQLRDIHPERLLQFLPGNIGNVEVVV